jgi:hypothetical protein
VHTGLTGECIQAHIPCFGETQRKKSPLLRAS